jgi:hypothetical protein
MHRREFFDDISSHIRTITSHFIRLQTIYGAIITKISLFTIHRTTILNYLSCQYPTTAVILPAQPRSLCRPRIPRVPVMIKNNSCVVKRFPDRWDPVVRNAPQCHTVREWMKFATANITDDPLPQACTAHLLLKLSF